MGYAITGGAGLLVGLALMIWALRERSAKAVAEQAERKAVAQCKLFEEAVYRHGASIVGLTDNLDAANSQIGVLRKRLEEARDRLIAREDPETLREWLDAELSAETI